MAAEIEFRIGLVIPRSASAGIYGPSCKSCADLAVAELNAGGGVDGAQVRLIVIDGGQKPKVVADAVGSLFDAGALSALVGMHDSDVRQAIMDEIGSSIPYVYAANYEGGAHPPNLLTVGLTTAQQIRCSLRWLKEKRGATDWFLLGNDYLWPRQLAVEFKEIAQDLGLRIIGSQYEPLGQESFASCLNAIEQAAPEGVFAALVGGDAVAFNRQFVRRGLDRSMLRFMPLLEENTLLAIGHTVGQGLHTAGTYFAGLEDPDGAAFQQRYEEQFGTTAPQLNAFGIACYEAINLLSLLFSSTPARDTAQLVAAAEGLRFPSIQGEKMILERHAIRDVLLTEASAGEFKLRERFVNVTSDGSQLVAT